MRSSPYWAAATVALTAAFVACDDTSEMPTQIDANRHGPPSGALADASYDFTAPVFGIATTPDGSILVAETVSPATEPAPGTSTTTVTEVSRKGRETVATIETPRGSPINGLETIGRGNFFATNGALDLAVAAGVWHVSRGRARLVGDIESFETQNDPDASEGPAWKDQRCEASEDFSAGPQSNPYHLTRLSGSTVLVADAAGNTLLSSSVNGTLDWVAVFTPPVKASVTETSSTDPDDWMVLFPLDEDTDCYVQPVPTSVDIGPDGDYYVGELTGVTPANIFEGASSFGLSRVWRIDGGATNVTCPSDDCEVVLSGLTSVMAVEFGPSGDLFVLEYDENGWFGATALENAAGGTLNRCDVDAGTCQEVEAGLVLPGDLAFDKWGDLWLLENNIGSPTVRTVSMD